MLCTSGVTASFVDEESCLKLPESDRKLRYSAAKQAQPDRLAVL